MMRALLRGVSLALGIDRFHAPENLYAAASSTRRGRELKTENRMYNAHNFLP